MFKLFVQAEKLDIEEKYENLKDEALGKTRKLKKVWLKYVNLSCLNFS